MITEQYKKSWNFLIQSKNYILFITIIFLLFSIIGFIFPIFFQEQILDFIKKITLEFEGLTTFQTIWKIFFNNLRASFFSLVLGVLLGIFPLMAAIANGYIIGFVARRAVTEEGILVLWKLLPHGIFELPAVLFSMGIGLRLGIELLKRNNWNNFKKTFVKSIKFFFLIVLPLLIIAGIIEGILIGILG